MPLLFKHNEPLWGVWKIEESSEELLYLLSRKIDYQPFLDNMRTENRKKEWLATRLLTKKLLNKEVRIDYHLNGAPYLPNENLQISISHTKGFVAVILSKDSTPGIDIEYRGDRILKIHSKFMSKDEYSKIDKKHEAEHLLLYWCAKETLFKIIQQEGVDFIDHLHIHPFPYNEEGSLLASETRTEQTASYQLKYYVFPDFVVTLNKI